MTLRPSLVGAIATAFSACLSGCGLESPGQARQAADLVFTNGSVYTVNSLQPWAQSVAITDGVIVYVGSNAGSEAFQGPHTQRVDLDGKMLLPGFQDSHLHPAGGGVDYTECPLFDASSREEILVLIERCATDRPEAPFIRGRGWYAYLFEEDQPPTRQMLDDIDDTRPLMFVSGDGHAIWVNSKSLDAFGLGNDTPDPPGGHVGRDPLSGDLTGLFHENSAMDLVRNQWPAYSDEDITAGFAYTQKLLNSLGVTAIQDANVKLGGRSNYRSLETYKKLNGQNRLTVRVSASLFWTSGAGIEQLNTFNTLRTEYSAGRLRVGTVKMWADGVVETHTARLLEPYSDQPDNLGILMIPHEEILQAVPEIIRQGFQLHYHAIGDAAVRYGLDAVEAAGGLGEATRPVFAHLQSVHPDDVSRFGQLKVNASFSPIWAYDWPYNRAMTVPRVGDERVLWSYPIQAIIDGGGRVAFGSDWPVSSANPLEGMEVAITRVDPQSNAGEPFLPGFAITLAEAIAAYTINSAYVNFLDGQTGTIEPGKYADLVVLDRNLFSIPASEISEAQVLLTLLEGKPVYGSLENPW